MKAFQYDSAGARHESSKGVPPRAILAASLFALVAVGPVTAGEYGNVPLNQSDLDWVKNCEIFSFGDIDLPGPFFLVSGPDDNDTTRADVCARGTVDVGSAGKNTKVPEEAPDLTDVAVIAPEIKLGKLSKTSECVYDAGQLVLDPKLNAKKVCPEQTALSGVPPDDVDTLLPTLADFMLQLPFPAAPPGGADITVASGGTYNLVPGNYGDVVVGSKGRIVFTTTGTYTFTSFRSQNKDSQIYVDFLESNVTVNVLNYLLLGHHTQWNGDETRNIKVYVAGADDYPNTGWAHVDGWGDLEPTFSMRGDGHFHSCWVYSPSGTQSWRGHSGKGAGQKGKGSYHVQSFTNQFIQEPVLSVRFESPQEEECFGAEYTCAAIGRIAPPGVTCDSASGVVSIPAWNASEKTLSYVGLIKEDALLPLAPTVQQFINASCVMFPSGDPDLPDPAVSGVPSNPVTYLSPGLVEDVIQTPDIWAAGALTNPNCADGGRLVPFAIGPLVEDNLNRQPVCFSAATYQFAQVNSVDTCTMVDP